MHGQKTIKIDITLKTIHMLLTQDHLIIIHTILPFLNKIKQKTRQTNINTNRMAWKYKASSQNSRNQDIISV